MKYFLPVFDAVLFALFPFGFPRVGIRFRFSLNECRAVFAAGEWHRIVPPECTLNVNDFKLMCRKKKGAISERGFFREDHFMIIIITHLLSCLFSPRLNYFLFFFFFLSNTILMTPCPRVFIASSL